MSYPNYTKSVICYIEAHITDEKINHDKLAQQIGYSWKHIRDMFRNDTGCSIARYIQGRKIKHSALDLIHTDKTILDIALYYGFSNPETYTRSFRRVTGMTPSEFRRLRPLVGKEELLFGVYGIELLTKKERRSDIMSEEIYRNNDSTILYGVPKAGWGEYGGLTPYPICLKSAAAYLGEDIDYSLIMAASGTAFRFAWNSTDWDLSNVDIFHTFTESNDVYGLAAKALGREFFILERNSDTTKEEFISFIKSHIDEGYPCIALGIIGPPEACIITGYRKNGEELLGWNFFQADPEFGGNVKIDESGYFISSSWWENSDTQAVMCMGAIKGERFSADTIIQNAVKALSGRLDSGYYKGISAYDEWINALSDEKNFTIGDNYSILFEKVLCQIDAMNCLQDGRNSAVAYFNALADSDVNRSETYRKIAEAFAECGKVIEEMRNFYGYDMDENLKNIADPTIRKQTCELCERAKQADTEALSLMNKLTV